MSALPIIVKQNSPSVGLFTPNRERELGLDRRETESGLERRVRPPPVCRPAVGTSRSPEARAVGEARAAEEPHGPP
ncbi:hypothetical protein LWI29_005740 [Acer saccharum]|uniref:Uncharacterized protein n=1 Tax=Acer saccharum TaxID=4024 RepID=A0AA39SNS0_ACESA|nr:hypothetical protein LWI29_005740 [Acer saccharum]